MGKGGKAERTGDALLAQRLELERAFLHGRHALAVVVLLEEPCARAALLEVGRAGRLIRHSAAEHVRGRAVSLEDEIRHRLPGEREIPVPHDSAGARVQHALLRDRGVPRLNVHLFRRRLAAGAGVVQPRDRVAAVRPQREHGAHARRRRIARIVSDLRDVHPSETGHRPRAREGAVCPRQVQLTRRINPYLGNSAADHAAEVRGDGVLHLLDDLRLPPSIRQRAGAGEVREERANAVCGIAADDEHDGILVDVDLAEVVFTTIRLREMKLACDGMEAARRLVVVYDRRIEVQRAFAPLLDAAGALDGGIHVERALGDVEDEPSACRLELRDAGEVVGLGDNVVLVGERHDAVGVRRRQCGCRALHEAR